MLKPIVNPRRRLRGVFCVALVTTIPVVAGISQVQHLGSMAQYSSAASPRRDGNVQDGLEDALSPADNEKRVIALSVQRQKEMTSDTSKLLELASQLKTEIDSGGEDALSLNALHQADEIARLAHSVREKMATPIMGLPGAN